MKRPRYGRHGDGPHAKQRWRKRRYGRHALNAVQETHNVVIPFPMSFVNTERIIVMADDGSQGLDEQKRVLRPIAGESSTEGPIARESRSQETRSPFHFSMVHAGTNAMQQAEKDLEQQDLKLDPVDLDKAAVNAWYDSMKDQNVALEANADELRSIRNLYTEKYKKEYTESIRLYDSNLIDAVVTSKLQRRAGEDLEDDTAHAKDLSPRHIEYQAVLRISELLKFDTRAKSGYLDALERYVPDYTDAYEKHRSQKLELSL